MTGLCSLDLISLLLHLAIAVLRMAIPSCRLVAYAKQTSAPAWHGHQAAQLFQPSLNLRNLLLLYS